MKKIFASAMIFAVGFASAQTVAYKGAGDVKVNLGANLQDGGTGDRKSTRLNSSHSRASRMPSSA